MASAAPRDLDREAPTGKVFRGEIGADGEPAEFTFALGAGQAIELTAAQVNGSDPAVKVYDAQTGDLVAENDDSNGSLASNVRLFSLTARKLRLEVTNAAVDGGGAMRFDLVLRPSDYRPNPVKDIALGDQATGTLQSGDEQLFRFHGQAGQVWEFALRAATGSNLDPALEVYAGDTATGESLGSDDDGGGGLNSRYSFLVPQTGTYVVRGYPIGSTSGDYTFSAGRVRAAAAAELGSIGLGSPETGTLDAGVREMTYKLSDEARSAIAGHPGGLIVELNHTGEGDGVLDPILDVGFETPLGFSSVAKDDDGAGNSNARVVLDASMLTSVWLEALRIKASAYQDTQGEYELTVRAAGED